MIFDHRNDAFVVGAVGVMKISLIDQNHGRLRNAVNEIAQVLLRGDAGRGIVGIANINQPFDCRCPHSRQVVRKRLCEWNLNDLRAVDLRVVENRFESRIGDDHLPATWNEFQGRSARRLCQFKAAPVTAHWTGKRRGAHF